ncbi:Vrp1, partial [Drosophila busckii]
MDCVQNSNDFILDRMNIPRTPATPPTTSSVNANGNAKAKPGSPTLSESSSSGGGSVKSKAANLSSITKTTTTTTTSATAAATTTSINRTTSTGTLRNLAPNKSTLFGGSAVGNGVGNSNSPTPASASTSIAQQQQLKPAIGHGKPNFAPKPPGLQQMALANGHQRPVVARHHSMKSPRSPPAAGAVNGPVFPTQQHFGTMRAPLQQPLLLQSSDNISGSTNSISGSMRCAPNPPKSRPSVKPPPPPTPARSISNSNLSSAAAPFSAVNTTLVQSVMNSQASSPSPPPAQPPPSNSSSSSSVAALRDQFRVGGAATPPTPPASSTASPKSTQMREKVNPIILNGGPINPLPLPPHRSCPPPPPPQRQSSNPGSNQQQQQQAPVPPQRHSSIRANTPLTPPTHLANATHNFGSSGVLSSSTASTGASVGRLVIDLEAKFGKRFHNVTEFPKPPPYLSIQKVYPSLSTLKATN